MCDLVLIKVLKIFFWLEKSFLPSFRYSVEFVMILIFFLLRFDMSTGKKAFCVFKQLK